MDQINSASSFLRQKYAIFTGFCSAVSLSVSLLIARIAAATVFWRSGQTKINGDGFHFDFWRGEEAAWEFKYQIFDVSARKYYLFANTYGIPEPFTKPMTHLATIGEFFLPLMLFFGLATRFGALGLLAMTAFIQFYVFPEQLFSANGNWGEHLLWTAPLLFILIQGPGKYSLDNWLGKKYGEADTTPVANATTA